MITNLKAVDSCAPLSAFAHQGYYVVGKEIFRNKVYAMQEATRKGLKPEDMSWEFNSNLFQNLDWRNPSGVALTELYRIRAQQLREKYSYLILAFSGGGDSTNMLDSFVLNNIPLDEVLVHWPRQQTAGRYTPSMNTAPENFNSEWDFLVEPKLKWLEKFAPNVKITFCDNLVDLRPDEPADNFIEVTAKHTWNAVKRYQAFDDVLMARQEKYKNCAIMLGVGPPFVSRLNRHFLTVFADGAANTYISDYLPQGHRNVEFFYWTPELPEIVREQCHALLANLKLNPQFLSLIPEWNLNKSNPGNQLTKRQTEDQRRWIKSVLYPTYDHRLLQVDKNNSPINRSEWHSWFYENPHSVEIVQPHQSAVTSHQAIIDPSFFITRNGEVHNYRTYFSKPYYIGDLY